MTRAQAIAAIEIGIEVVEAECDAGLDLVATGDMGIGNTTASAAIVAAITGLPPAQVTGRGTGVDDAGLARKVAAIESGLAVNRPNANDALDVLTKVGGFEIGALAGVILGAAARRRAGGDRRLHFGRGGIDCGGACSAGEAIPDCGAPIGRGRASRGAGASGVKAPARP